MINHIPLPSVSVPITGRKKCRRGYIKVRVIGHPMANEKGWVWEHRLVMANHLGRCIFLPEVIHHKDRNKTNNNINNLMLFASDYEHSLEHQRMDRKKGSTGWENTRRPILKKKFKTCHTQKADYSIRKKIQETPPPEFAKAPAECLGLKQRIASRQEERRSQDFA